MLVEVLDEATPTRALILQRGRRSLAAIVDGAGSWGTGREAADLCRATLSSLWAASLDWSAAQLVRDVTEAALATPNDLRDAEFGWSFSVTALLCTDGVVECVAAGFYRVDVVRKGHIKTLFRPTMFVDELLANGTLTPDAVAAFPHREICIGPFVGDKGNVSLSTVSHPLAPDEVVLVTHAARHNAALTPGATLPSSAKALAAMATAASYPSPVMLVRR